MKKLFQEALQNTVQRAWDESLAKVNSIQEDMAQRLRDVRQRADWPHNREELQRVISDLKLRLQTRGETLEKRVEDSVRAAMARVREPLTQELASLKSKAEQLGQRIDQIRNRPENKSGTKSDGNRDD